MKLEHKSEGEKMSVYTKKGYTNRKDYLRSLADEYCVPCEVVFPLAAMLGPDEDFDGLISALEDAEGMFNEA